METKTTILIKSQGVRRKSFLSHYFKLILSCRKLIRLFGRIGSSDVRRKSYHKPPIIVEYGLSKPNLVRLRKRATYSSFTNPTKVAQKSAT